MYTHCPNCDTHFEISQEYLDIANGKVRCGQCDHIFNALDNLYEKKVSSPENAQTPTVHSNDSVKTSNNSTEQTTPDKSQFGLSSPSIDIKEKMERIAASLSAATAELKNARKSSYFYKHDKKPEQKHTFSPEQPNKTEEVLKPKLTEDNTESLEAELPEDNIEILEPELTEENIEILEAELPEDNIETLEPELPEENTESFEAELTEDNIEILEPELPEDNIETLEPELPEDNIETLEPELPEEGTESFEAELPEDNIETLEPELPEEGTESLEPDPLKKIDDELDLVTYDENDLNESSVSTEEDYNPHNVDEGDIDILNSLMDTQDNNSSSSALLNELDDINKTLSDSSDASLDDEFSSLGNDFDDLDNGDDLLAELEQLENEFLNKGNTPTDKSPVEETSPEDNYTPADGSSQAEGSSSGNIFSTGSDNKPVAEEVVPSFLTQGDSSSTNPATMLGWLAGTIILLLVLAAQYLHVNSIKFSQDPSFRPLLETLCPITNCPLPLISNPGKIVTVSHDVRSHPKVNNALEIQLTFKNKAHHTQDYPILEITFSNPIGEVIAQRKFLPDEYLTGDIQYSRGLKANQSQEINLKIVDPDPGSELSFQFNYL